MATPLFKEFKTGQLVQFEISETLKTFSQLDGRKMGVLSVIGLPRAGKSTFLNYVSSFVDGKPVGRFLTGNGRRAVTHGVDFVLLELPNNKLLLLLDVEGLLNEDRPELDLYLAIVSQLSDHIVFMDKNINDTFRACISRLVCARVSMDGGGPLSWPQLHVIENMAHLSMDADTITRIFAVGEGVTEETSRVSQECILSQRPTTRP